MKDWQETLVGPETSLREALGVIDRAGAQIALVVDEGRRLLGTLSDGDVRRALLGGADLTGAVTAAMHAGPTTVREGEEAEAVLTAMRRLAVHQMPIVNAERVVVGLATVDDFLTVPARDHWVVIMAGGLGQRLEQLTAHTPKPMLPVGSRPLLETIVRAYAAQGFRRFYLAVNYRADQIEAHFGDGSALGIDVRYLREQRRMGTAGALGLLPERPTHPFVVTNADLLTKHDFGFMVDDHVASGAAATMAVRDYEVQVPFGVVHVCDGAITDIVEKPTHRYVVSGGMYVLSPEVLDLVPPGEYLDMPTLFHSILRAGLRARCHPVGGYWLDIGRAQDYERANLDYAELFR